MHTVTRIPDSLVTLDTWSVRVNGQHIATVDLPTTLHVQALADTLRRGDPAADVELILTAHERGMLDRLHGARGGLVGHSIRTKTRVSAW